jgi:hypothetical protein
VADLGHWVYSVGRGNDRTRLAYHASGEAGHTRMIRAIPSSFIYLLFVAALALATAPVWRLWLFGFNPTLEDVLSLRCMGL